MWMPDWNVDDRFAVNPQCIFHALDWIERNAVATSVHFTERKQFQSEMNVGQLVNHNNVRRMISDHQISSLYFLSEELFSTFTICCWMSLLKLGSLGYTLSSWLALQWAKIIQVVARQCGQTLTDEQVNTMD